MHKSPFRTVALALAVPGLALAVPAIAAPSAHSAAYANSAVWGDQSVNHNHKRKHQRNNRYDSRYYGGYGSQQGYYGEPVYANTRVWRGDNGQYYCRKSNGTTGMLIGAAGGALLGREIAGRYGDRTLGAILGAAGGALLGREIAQSGTRCR
jgi:hypothetical protein